MRFNREVMRRGNQVEAAIEAAAIAIRNRTGDARFASMNGMDRAAHRRKSRALGHHWQSAK